MSNSERIAIPAILYAAKSTADVHGSIPTQLSDGKRLANREAWSVVGEYSDEAASAYSGDRGPGLASAMAHAERLAREYGTCSLISQHSDRLARGDGRTAKHLIEYALWALKHSVRLVSVQDPEIFSEGEMGLLLSAIGGLRNHQDSKRKALAVRDGMKRRRDKGLHTGGPRKYGYDYVRDEYGRTVQDQPMRPHPTEALIVERIFRDYEAGITQMSIQRALNAENVPALRGGRWHQGTIAKIVADPFYKGSITDGDNLIEGRHQAIVDPALWNRVAAIRAQARRSLGRAGGRPPSAEFLFTNGHLRCGRCGGAVIPRTIQRRSSAGKSWGKPYAVYRCYTRICNPDNCDQRNLPRAAVDAAAIDALTERGISVRQTRAELALALARRRAEAHARLEDARAEEQKAADAQARIDRDYTEGALSAANYERLAERVAEGLDAPRAQREQAERHAADLGATKTEIDDAALVAFGDVHEAIADFLADARHLPQLRLRLRQLFSSFTIHNDGTSIALLPDVRADALDAVMADVCGLRRERLSPITDANGLARTSSPPWSNTRTRSSS